MAFQKTAKSYIPDPLVNFIGDFKARNNHCFVTAEPDMKTIFEVFKSDC